MNASEIMEDAEQQRRHSTNSPIQSDASNKVTPYQSHEVMGIY